MVVSAISRVGISLAVSQLVLIAGSMHDGSRADDFSGLGFLPGSTVTYGTSISADGSTAAGEADIGGVGHAYTWRNGVMTDLTPGGSGYVGGISADGSAVVGSIQSAPQAVIWKNGVQNLLGYLPGGSFSYGYGMSADGSVVSGQSQLSGGALHAFRWTQATGMVDLGSLAGQGNSFGMGVSADGSVIVGYTDTNAFRWTQATGMVALDPLIGGTDSRGLGISSDGSTAVGYSTVGGLLRATKWVSGIPIDLGVVPGGTYSVAAKASADGSVIVGYGNVTAGGSDQAIRWTQATGMRSISSLLIANGVSLTGWSLKSATDVSGNGLVVVGRGTDPSGQEQGWLARFTAPSSSTPDTTVPTTGFLTFDGMTRSLASLSAVAQTGSAAIGATLGTLTELATQTSSEKSPNDSGYSAFGYAGYDSDPGASGSIGITKRMSNQLTAGLMLSGNAVNTYMAYDGNAKMKGASVSGFLSHRPAKGLQWMLAVTGITLKGKVNRGYLNGSNEASSSGTASSYGLGTAFRIGWTFDTRLRSTQISPFASYSFSTIRIKGYTETDGAFPAVIDSFRDETHVTRFGLEARTAISSGKWIWGSLASAHKLNNSKTDDVSGTLIGLLSMSGPANSTAKDWTEITTGVRWSAWRNGALSTSVMASIPANYPTTYQARVSISQSF